MQLPLQMIVPMRRQRRSDDGRYGDAHQASQRTGESRQEVTNTSDEATLWARNKVTDCVGPCEKGGLNIPDLPSNLDDRKLSIPAAQENRVLKAITQESQPAGGVIDIS